MLHAGGSIKVTIKVERMMDSKSAAKVSYDLMQNLKARKQRYCDPDFPTDNRSLFTDKSKHGKDEDGKWKSEVTLPVLFCPLFFSFICQHSTPGVVSVIWLALATAKCLSMVWRAATLYRAPWATATCWV